MDKAHILREIKRTAEANGGKPLGIARFENETGIKLSDWRGVHWARWGDALSEAGYLPNELKQAHEITKLLEQYAQLTVEIKRFPASADIRLKSKRVTGFPNDKTFFTVRFETRASRSITRVLS